jgi:UDP-N-acetylmuramyl pentapeptide phosphotransferase/UDP-N-acetylglucosamine-1-phosphate transferase
LYYHKFKPEFQYFFAAATVIFFLGLKDDILILSATKKFFVQLLVAAIIVHMGGLRIDSMHGLFGYFDLPEGLSLALSYISIIVVINAFNLIDGVDGLAGLAWLVKYDGVWNLLFYKRYAALCFIRFCHGRQFNCVS